MQRAEAIKKCNKCKTDTVIYMLMTLFVEDS